MSRPNGVLHMRCPNRSDHVRCYHTAADQASSLPLRSFPSVCIESGQWKEARMHECLPGVTRGACRQEHAAGRACGPRGGACRAWRHRDRRLPDDPRAAAAAVRLRAPGRHLPGCASFTPASLPGSQRRFCAADLRIMTAKLQHTLVFMPSRRDDLADGMNIPKVGGQLRSSAARITKTEVHA